MAGAPSAQDVADALAMTLEREDPSGAPWCPPGDAVALRRWVTDRSASLGTGIRRVVRLARLMALADGRDYVSFAYVRLTTLRARLFRQAFERAFAEGRIQKSDATLSDSGMHLREAAATAEGGTLTAFEIDFAQMPRLAALLDFLHNALGFAVVADLLAPALRRGAGPDAATEVSRALHAALNAWLSQRLESANHMLQAQRIRTFLATRGGLVPESIDDAGILLFWITMAEAAEDERIEGFRLYRSAAAAMLRYRQALRDAASARHLEQSLGRGLETADDLTVDAGASNVEAWQSPLRALMLSTSNRVKWLTSKEQHQIANYLGGHAEDRSDDESGDQDEPALWRDGLAGAERFDLAFWLTLLRADVFGTVQASIVARLRKRSVGSTAIDQAMAQIDDKAYAIAAAAYVEVSQQLHLEALAALAVLMEAGAAEALILLEHLGGRPAVQAVIGTEVQEGMTGLDDSIGDELRRKIASALGGAYADPSSVPEGTGRKLILEALAALRKVARAGFRREDRGDAAFLAAFRSGAAAVIELARELDRLGKVLPQRLPQTDFVGDQACFLATYRRIYLSQQ